MKKIKFLAIVGPTASGKSSLALALAEQLGGEIISCDSMQVYRGMDIGTAKPTKEEQERVTHHLIDVVAPQASFSCADYIDLAGQAISNCEERGVLPILCGGTGLYLDALLRGNEWEAEGANAEVRDRLWEQYKAEGATPLHEMLRQVDPESAASIHPNNVRRVIRAIEIFQTTGVPKSELDRRSQQTDSPWDACVIGLRYGARHLLYERIEARVDQMMAEGLEEETRRLLEAGVFETNTTAAQAIGYKELFAYLRGEESRATAIATLKTATRRYAKRQMTWFSAKPYVTWLDADHEGRVKSFEKIVNNAKELFSADGICGKIE